MKKLYRVLLSVFLVCLMVSVLSACTEQASSSSQPVNNKVAKVDKSELRELIDTFDGSSTLIFTDDSRDKMTSAISQAKLVEANDKATQSEVDGAILDCKDALGGLKEISKFPKYSKRDYKKLLRDPDSYRGKAIQVWGEVTQYDSATGNEALRANISYKKKALSYGYSQYEDNVIIEGDEEILSKLVEGDLFFAKAIVVGSFSYDTQIGGSTTVPELHVMKVKRYGSVD